MSFYSFYSNKVLKAIDGAGLLVLRLWLAQEFCSAGLMKLSGGWEAPSWFIGLNFPLPVSWLPYEVNWIVAALAEIILGAALALGLFSRFAALGLLFITWVAVYSVHFDLGWAGWNLIDTDEGQGFKVPLMFAVMLLTIVTQGGGRFAVDWAMLRLLQFKPERPSVCPETPT